MYTCEICGRESFKKIRYGGYTLCSKHMHQIQKYGKFFDNNPRTQKDKNAFRIEGNIAIFDVYARNNEKIAEFIIDKEDVDKIKYHHWRMSYGRIVTGNHTKTKPTTYLTHLLLNIKETDYEHKIDHIDGNPLNNRKANLRICTQGENVLNKIHISNNTSGVIGVSRDKRNGRSNIWCAEIRYQHQRWHIGQYATIAEAAYARHCAETLLFKEFRHTTHDEEKAELFKTISQKRKDDIEKYVTTKLHNRVSPM